jgi:hypothetical protein
MKMTFEEFYQKYATQYLKPHCSVGGTYAFRAAFEGPANTKPVLWLFIYPNRKVLVGSLARLDGLDPTVRDNLLDNAPLDVCFKTWENEILRLRLERG